MENTYEIQTDTSIYNGWPPITSYGKTPGKAKYAAYLDRSECFGDFITFLRGVISCRKVPCPKPEAMPQLFPGDMVRMAGCPEAEKYGDRLFKVRTRPESIGGNWCV